MKVLKPYYYDQFKCVADKCEDTCCVGWTVHIDRKTYKSYEKIKGCFGNKLNNSILRNRTGEKTIAYGKMKMNDGRCAMLNDENLCEVVIKLNEDSLCNTCKTYPRSVIKYGEVYEKDLSLSCPETAKFLVDNQCDFSFILDDEKIRDEENKYDHRLYKLLWESRNLCMEIAQFKEIELWKRLIFIKIASEKIQSIIEKGNYNTMLYTLNNIRTEVTDIHTIESLDRIPSQKDLKNDFVKECLQTAVDGGVSNETFLQLIHDFNSYNFGYNDNQLEEEFDKYIHKKSYILENFLMYLIYKHFMETLNRKEISMQILNILISYTMVKNLLLVRWMKKGKKLERKDWIEVLYSFSRVVEHNPKYLNLLYEKIHKKGYEKIAYLAILVR